MEERLLIFPLFTCVTFSVPVLSVTTSIIFAFAVFTSEALVDIELPRILLTNN